MGIREELRKRARFLEAQQEKKAARLDARPPNRKR